MAEVIVCDYSRRDSPQIRACPHDLVWFDVAAVPADAPDWARAVIQDGQPGVIRRAPRDGHTLPVGLRGADKRQRWAGRIEAAAVRRRLSPEAIDLRAGAACDAPPRWRDMPIFTALAGLAERLADIDACWGITGALGYEYATGCPVAHADSDIDLLVRMPRCCPDTLTVLGGLMAGRSGPRYDIQLETPAGGVALADWQSPAREVMVKSDTGPYLCHDPWQPQ